MTFAIRSLIPVAFAIGLSASPSSTTAAPLDLFYEGNNGSFLGDGGVQVQTYAAFNDVLTASFVNSVPTLWTIGPNIDLAGVAYDGQYRLFYEGDAGSFLGDGGVQVQTYGAFNDVLTASFVSSVPTSWTIGPNIDLVGVAYDGQYRLFYEGDAGSFLGDGGVQVQTYATFDDILTASFVSSIPTSWTIGPNIDLVGVAYDGQYRLFYEGDAGSFLGDGGVQVQTYTTFDDILTASFVSSVPTSWTIGPNIDLAGVVSPDTQSVSVPTFATSWLLLGGLGALGFFCQVCTPCRSELGGIA